MSGIFLDDTDLGQVIVRCISQISPVADLQLYVKIHLLNGDLEQSPILAW